MSLFDVDVIGSRHHGPGVQESDPTLLATPWNRMSRPLRAALLATCTLAAIACSGDPSASGIWVGSALELELRISLTEQDDGSITGLGTLTGRGSTVDLVVTGDHTHPALSLTLATDGFESFVLEGTFETDELVTGRLTGSGFQDNEIVIRHGM